jgi:hypothetical protein
VRRGAAWPLAERPSSCLTARSAVWRTDRAASPPSLHGTPSAAGAVRRNTVRRPSGQPLGVVAQDIRSWPCLVSLSGPSSIRRPVSGVSGQCPRVRCPVSGVRCPVSGVQCPVWGIQASRCPVSGCPVWASGVRCPVGRPGIWPSGVRYPGFPPLLCPNRVSPSSAPIRRAATRRGRPESAWSPRTVSTTGWSSARVGA